MQLSRTVRPLWVLAWTFSLVFFPTFGHSADPVLKLPRTEFTLPNGFKALLVRYPSPGVVAYRMGVKAGSRNEVEKGKSGFAHFFEHLMFRGTKNISAKDFGDLYVKLGCENNAFTDYDMTVYHGVVSKDFLPQILEVEADRFANLFFDEKALREEAGAVLGEYNKSAAQPELIMEEKLHAAAFKTHPYGHTTLGYRDDIVQYPERYSDVWPFFKRNYRPENVFLVLVGDVDFASAKTLVERKFSSWKGEPIEPAAIPPEPTQDGPRNVDVSWDQPTQSRLIISYRVPPFLTRESSSPAIALLSEILFSPVSEFQKEFRFEKKWVDSVSFMGTQWVHSGLWQLWLRLTEAGEGKQAEILAAVEKKIAAVRKEPPSKKTLEATQLRFRNQALTQWFSGPEALAGILSYYAIFETDLGVLDRTLEGIKKATREDLSLLAQKIWIDSNRTVLSLKGKSK